MGNCCDQTAQVPGYQQYPLMAGGAIGQNQFGQLGQQMMMQPGQPTVQPTVQQQVQQQQQVIVAQQPQVPLQGVPPRVQQLNAGQVFGLPAARSQKDVLPAVPAQPNTIATTVPAIPQQVPTPALSNKTIVPTQLSSIQGRDLIRQSLDQSFYFGLKNPSLLTSSHPSTITPGTSGFYFGQGQRF